MTSPYAELQLARDGDIAILTLDNPARLNPISATLQARLLAAHAAEPLLYAGGWLSPAVRGFIGAAAAAHAQEHRAAQA